MLIDVEIVFFMGVVCLVYVGKWKHDKMHGQGHMQYNNRDVYEVRHV